MKFQGVIFDLDGTLVDSLTDIADSMNRVLIKFKFPTHHLSAYKYFIGNGLRNLVRMALPETSRDEETINLCFKAMMADYGEHCTDKTLPYAGIRELLDELTKRGLKQAIFSNKADELTQKVVRTIFSEWKFEIVIGASEDIPRKPDPFGAQLICEELKLKPQDIIYLGDTGVDMQTATRAGMYAVGALWGFRTPEELNTNGALSLINHPLEFLGLID